MARNKLTDLNNHLFAQLERLNDEELTEEQINLEVRRSKAVSAVASQIIQNARVTVDAMKLVTEGNLTMGELPEMIGANKGKNE